MAVHALRRSWCSSTTVHSLIAGMTWRSFITCEGTGTAAQMLWGTEEMSFRQLIARLCSRFGNLEMKEKYQAELQCRRMTETSTVCFIIGLTDTRGADAKMLLFPPDLRQLFQSKCSRVLL